MYAIYRTKLTYRYVYVYGDRTTSTRLYKRHLVHVCACMYVYVFVCMCVYDCICMDVFICVWMCMNIYSVIVWCMRMGM